MFRIYLATAATSAALAVAVPSAMAQHVSMPPHPDLNLAAFSGDANALPEAVRAVEAASGGRVLEIRYDNVAGVPGYDLVLVRAGRVSFERFSQPGAGLVVLAGHTEPRWMLDWRANDAAKLVQHAKVSLAQAIRTAEKANNGAPAAAAGIARSATNPVSDVHAYNVLLQENGGTRRVAVDAETGMIIANPRALSAWP